MTRPQPPGTHRRGADRPAPPRPPAPALVPVPGAPRRTGTGTHRAPEGRPDAAAARTASRPRRPSGPPGTAPATTVAVPAPRTAGPPGAPSAPARPPHAASAPPDTTETTTVLPATTRATPAPDPVPPAAPEPAPPRERASRLLGVDATRGVALLGIIAVHALVEATDDGTPTPSYLVFGGRSAALFAVLAGVSFAFMTGRARVRTGPDLRAAAAMLATRAGVLMVLALALSWTDPSIAALILPYYAIAFLLAIPLVALPTRVLAPLAVLLGLGIPVGSHLVRPFLPVPDLGNPSVLDLVTDPGALLSELTLTGAYPAVVWLAYMAAGIVVGRLRLSDRRTAAALLAGGVVAAAAATGLSMWLLGPGGGYAAIAAVSPPEILDSAPTIADAVTGYPDGVTPTSTWWWLATVAPHSGTPLDVVQTTGSALAVLGAVLLLASVTVRGAGPLLGHLLRPLAAAGSMTLTLYLGSILFMNSPLDDLGPWEGYLWQIAVAVGIGLAWRRAVGRGPLETVVSAPAHAVRDRLRGRARDRVA
ncbi:heparan-alpha-glucosaminide N-acetyltransferase domain-containing protein [Pseudonocardia alni]|uniref:Membrane protein YeiB n=1 Tax=Pseudonocardia alni TaxID=33907 RepID=A0AA44ULK8_PSEA5|nr:heparan-alpha-glucosaminide N-acetyltransferase domain-containing protein [Pseudonocardia alni]PKB29375.1 putative membrane protein YeiB [Pseudonocardia alni]